MKKKDFYTIKSNRPFELCDVFVYAFIVVFILSLFLAFIVFPKKQNAGGFSVSFDGQTIFSLEYDTLKTSTFDFDGTINFDKEKNVITVYFNKDKTEYNQITFNGKEKWVKVTDSTCSISKDCVHLPEIKTSGAIICAPHKLKITALSSSGFTPAVTG